MSTFIGDALACSDYKIAYAYILSRMDDAAAFSDKLQWKIEDCGLANTVNADVYGVRIVHFIDAGPDDRWGELFIPLADGTYDNVVFHSHANFVAYMLAKYW